MSQYKQYYKLFNPITNKVEIWHGDPQRSSVLRREGVLILPLGAHKPSNVSREAVKEF